MAINTQDLTRLARTRTVDLTTIGRRSGLARTVEIWWFPVDGRFIITGTPGRRDWLANIRSNPAVTVSVPHGDFGGIAHEIDDPVLRHRVFTDPAIGWYRTQAELDYLVEAAPMVEVRFA